jgi:hypothetical protein
MSCDFGSNDRIKIAEFPIDLVLNNVFCSKKVFEYQGLNYEVKMNSQRYFMFRENLCCVCCFLKGTRMFLEYHESDKVPHFNLYGEYDSKLILMTKDHIIARALGGEDKHSNYQTMCLICNNLKGHSSLTLDSLKKLRKVFDQNRSILTKKKLHFLIEETKKRLEKSHKLKKPPEVKNNVVLKIDLNCYYKENSFIGIPVYESPPRNKTKIGCIKRGTILNPILEYKNKLFCELNNDQCLEIKKNYVKY